VSGLAILETALKQMEIVKALEQSIELWKTCQLTSDEFSVVLSHASQNFNQAEDSE
jgi:predicted methyltransferase